MPGCRVGMYSTMPHTILFRGILIRILQMPEQIPFEDIYIPEGDFHIYDLQKAEQAEASTRDTMPVVSR